ncbi:Inositolphosphorylceramide synthase subunit Kei1-domain-containing protein [Lasiosphaeria miniovina]|uniref:Inositolphosphorylceramide synthase subunit Kei1-domain-containing protein n=1 Tax=Lasiosphaeria miniovina TaxID=1954250 RepID=A0AA39ZQ86_9PEZI|nr:Inositolphosphorylceramide synthase subunit Kei1-domain-containing protein [Lasiosphaeria miniovina]KAK0701621.1 Inositolphosphorylceramide synthase subunit Kei1-domain-containing protein [Lasiosphaeria miniovina]
MEFFDVYAFESTFLGLFSVQTGSELISLALLFNRATGIYGILTLFTGYSVSALQVSLYVLSLLVVVALGYLIPHIRKQSPLQNLVLAWLYVIDTTANVAFTAAFATRWYNAALHDPKGPAGAGDTDAKASPSNGEVQHDDGHAAQANADVGVQETVVSMSLAVAFVLVRVYFALVIMTFARMVLRRFADENASQTEEGVVKGTPPDIFAVGSALGDGWKARLGRVLVSIGRGYWLGRPKEDEEWAQQVSTRFRV